MQYLQHLKYYGNFLKNSVNLNLRTARLPTPEETSKDV